MMTSMSTSFRGGWKKVSSMSAKNLLLLRYQLSHSYFYISECVLFFRICPQKQLICSHVECGRLFFCIWKLIIFFFQHFTPTPSVKRTMRRCGNTGRCPNKNIIVSACCREKFCLPVWGSDSFTRFIAFLFSLENDNFVVWEMFPENNEALCESGEEEDFYFSDNDWADLKCVFI